MRTFRLTLKLVSPLATPIQGDTLFGHLCWGIAYHEGEDALLDFLRQYESEPPLAISNGFPHHMLPKPMLAPDTFSEPSRQELDDLKRLKKRRFIPAELFFDSQFRFSTRNLLHRLAEPAPDISRTLLHTHNTINRLTGTVQEGGLYTVKETFPSDSGKLVDIYLATSLDENRLRQLMEWALEHGYGADKTTGKGALEIRELAAVALPETGNRRMALGHFVPAAGKQLDGLRADLFTKYGKLGGHFVLTRNPFKKPILMYKAGSTMNANGPGKPFIGTLLGNIHKDPDIRHHALAPVIRYHEEEPS